MQSFHNVYDLYFDLLDIGGAYPIKWQIMNILDGVAREDHRVGSTALTEYFIAKLERVYPPALLIALTEDMRKLLPLLDKNKPRDICRALWSCDIEQIRAVGLYAD
jgi:hypothetical protein